MKHATLASAMRVGRALGLAAAIWIVAATGPALGRDDDDAPAAGPTQKPQLRSPQVNAARAIGDDEVEGPSIFEGLPALNPVDDARDRLRVAGLSLYGVYVGDPYGLLSGGLRRGGTYSGRLDIEADLDAAKVFGLPGATLHANLFQIHGEDLSNTRVGNFLSIDDIGALPSTRLYEAWYEQRLGEHLSLRLGQQGIDVEFLTSDYAANFINASFGWPGLPSVDLPDGGPAYPLATPAARLRYVANDKLTFIAAVFDGDPAGPCAQEKQTCDPAGLNFRVGDPPLVIAEAHYRYNRSEGADSLPGTLKLGAFGHFGRFADDRLGSDGRSLAVRGSDGMPVEHFHDGAFYGIVDQQIYRDPGAADEKGVGLFARVIGAPADRNLVDLYLDVGVSAFGVMPSRPDDLFGAAAAFAKVSPNVAASDRDRNADTNLAGPVRDYEAVFELTYQARIVPGLAVQPDFQYILHPGGHVPDPYGNGITAIRNAAVFGATMTLRF